MEFYCLPGTVDYSVVIRIVDSTDRTPENAVVSATPGLVIQYRREGAVNQTLTLSDLAALTTAHTDGGILLIGNGYYRLDLPDAATATNASGVMIHGTATGMIVEGCYVHLDGVPINLTQTTPDTPVDDSVGAAIGRILTSLPLDSEVGEGPGLATAFNVYDLMVRATIATVADEGDYTLIFDGYGGNDAQDGQFASMYSVFRDGPNAKLGRVISVYTGLTKRVQHTDDRSDHADAPFPNTPEEGNQILILGLR
jgi:hypothetical protein